MNRYVSRIISYVEANPQATLKEARGKHPEPEYAYRTSFVLRLPVASEWIIVRRTIIRKGLINTDSELDSFLRHAGIVLGSKPYAEESRALVGIEDNIEIPFEEAELGIEDDDYDDGAT